jgi:3-deoxy-D-manno-octulosonic-acid transferase
MWRFAYTVVLYALVPFALARLWWLGRREPGYRRRVAERFGRYRDSAGSRLLWVHAVSVGEARASAELVRSLGAAHPDDEILVTCTTAAGREMLKEVHGESVRIAWLPYDTPGAVQRFLEHYRPRLGILVETEIWPNLMAGCREFGVPVLLANARMSEKSAEGYRRLSLLMRPALASIAAVGAQSAEDAGRLRALGARRVEVLGNLKFDSAPDEAMGAEGRAWRARVGRPVLLLASTREGEERMLLEPLPRDARALTLVVPRHARRFGELAPLAQSRRSRDPLPHESDRIHLGDTMGEMDFYYSAADVAVMGGSFAGLGGQNLIEACAAGVPVVLGPSMFNFAEATRLALEAGAAVQVNEPREAVRTAFSLLEDEERRNRMGEAGKRLCEVHRGATRKHLALCEELLKAPTRD